MTEPRDPTLDVLLDLDGQVLVVDPEGSHRVRFVVTRVPVSPEKPHGIDYSLTLHGPDGERLVGFDMRIQWHGRSAAIRRTIATGCEQSGPMSTGTRRPCLPTSGKRWTRCCAREELSH
ncbi:MAG: hypothetical protein WA303_17685, partial [Bradyrhizobium sp.]